MALIRSGKHIVPMPTTLSEYINIEAFLDDSVTLLRNNLVAYPAFDPSRPYEEKNAYIVELMRQGEQRLFVPHLDSVAERYLATLLTVTLDFEQENKKHFNKGMVYANLGIIQMALGKVDAGIAHLLMANEEDRPFVPDPHGVLNGHLWQQFEDEKIFKLLIELNGSPQTNLHFTIDQPFLLNLFRGMELQDRMFLEGTLWAIFENSYLNVQTPNIYTRGRLYSGLKDLCLLTEALLRKKQVATGTINPNNQTLGDRKGGTQPGLLSIALRPHNIGYPQIGLNVWAENLQALLDNLEDILYNASSPEIRRIYCLHLIRNFTGHQFDLSDGVTSPTGRTFFDLFDDVLVNVLSAILYLKFINEI